MTGEQRSTKFSASSNPSHEYIRQQITRLINITQIWPNQTTMKRLAKESRACVCVSLLHFLSFTHPDLYTYRSNLHLVIMSSRFLPLKTSNTYQKAAIRFKCLIMWHVCTRHLLLHFYCTLLPSQKSYTMSVNHTHKNKSFLSLFSFMASDVFNQLYCSDTFERFFRT